LYYGEFGTQGDGNKTGDGSLSYSSALIDMCLCTVSRAPKSYTGEDTVEFHCHGSPVVLAEVLQALFKHRVRQALPGEFTKRAFLNGRMDLTQAEAVIDLIESETSAAAQNAVGQLRGTISLKMDAAYDRLVDIMAHFHAVLDYPDEDIDEFKLQNYLDVMRSVEDELRRLLATHERGKVLRDGIPTAIIGRPNTGKSSLLNALLGYERAIVTDIAGTTRDTIEEKLLIGNVLLRLIDTAGLRGTDDTLERIGVCRTLTAIRGAGLVLLVLDGSEKLTPEDYDALRSIPPDIPKIAVVNKSDLPAVLDENELTNFDLKICSVSALSGEGLSILDAEIKKMFPFFENSLGENGTQGDGSLVFLTNARQAEAISRAAESLRLVTDALTASVTPDAVLTDLEASLTAIGDVTGKTMNEDIVSRIFERFCVGK